MPAKLEHARTTEAGLRTKLDEARAVLPEIDAQLEQRSFAAHTGDEAAKRALEKLSRKKAEQTAEIESLAIALKEAGRRVAAAEHEAALAAERELAHAVLNHLAEFKRAGKAVDEALATAVSEYAKARKCLVEMNALGCTSPTITQLRSLGNRAAMTALMGSDLQIEHLAPRERVTLAEIVNTWSARVEHWATARTGEPAKEVA